MFCVILMAVKKLFIIERVREIYFEMLYVLEKWRKICQYTNYFNNSRGAQTAGGGLTNRASVLAVSVHVYVTCTELTNHDFNHNLKVYYSSGLAESICRLRLSLIEEILI